MTIPVSSQAIITMVAEHCFYLKIFLHRCLRKGGKGCPKKLHNLISNKKPIVADLFRFRRHFVLSAYEKVNKQVMLLIILARFLKSECSKIDL